MVAVDKCVLDSYLKIAGNDGYAKHMNRHNLI